MSRGARAAWCSAGNVAPATKAHRMPEPSKANDAAADAAAIDAYVKRTQAATAIDLVFVILFAGSLFACVARRR